MGGFDHDTFDICRRITLLDTAAGNVPRTLDTIRALSLDKRFRSAELCAGELAMFLRSLADSVSILQEKLAKQEASDG